MAKHTPTDRQVNWLNIHTKTNSLAKTDRETDRLAKHRHRDREIDWLNIQRQTDR